MNPILRSVSFVVLIGEMLASSSRFSHQKCGLYGQPPCSFVPSTAGVTPVCAMPGKTYCEFVQNYPVQQIRSLLDKWGIDNVNDLIVDETVDDLEMPRFNDIPWYNDQKPPDPHQTPTFTELPNTVPGDGGYHHVGDAGYNYPNPNKVHSVASPATPPPLSPPLLPPVQRAPPAPSSTAGYLPNNNAYTVNHNPGANRYWSGFSYSINQRPALNNNYLPIEPRYTLPQFIHSHPNAVTVAHRPAQWMNRYVRDISSHRRLAREAPNNSTVQSISTLPTSTSSHLPHFNSSRQHDISKVSKSSSAAIDSNSGHRIKRQSAGREQLCQTTYQYITPQAALNSQGSWMYIVNQVDTTRQLVRTETCASSVCSNLCQLPNGYSSRCEQKYVQKRLIALNADGTNLYTDTFWFPSCCACTIAGP